tara:strand:+ start:2072 stop:2680 length:609 start_codon:yes stop_codon:yes gene_type:complete
MTTTTVQPMEKDNNYYIFRDKKKTEEVLPILYLDNGLTIYTDKTSHSFYNNKENTDNISPEKMNRMVKKYGRNNIPKTKAELEVSKLDALIVDFKKNKKGTKVILTANPDYKLPHLNKHKDTLNKEEVNELIDIGNSYTYCPDIETPKCLLGFSLKTDELECSYAVCNEKRIGTLLIDVLLISIGLAIIYISYKGLYRHFKK